MHGTEAIALDCHNIDLEVRPEENSRVVVGIGLAVSTAVVAHPSCLFPNYMVIELEVNCDMNLGSSDVAAIVSIVEGRLVVVADYIEPLKGRQLALD